MSETAEMEVLDAPAQVAIFDPIEAGLAVLREEAAKTVFDVTTTSGLKAAKEFKGRLVSTRTATIGAYEDWNQPILEQQRAAREKRDYILAEVKKIEEPVAAQITAQEAVKAAEKAERDRIEAERVAAAQAKIDAINAYPVRAATADAAGIQDLHDELAGIEPSLETYGSRAGEAIQARDKALATLASLHAAAVAREEAARVLAKQQAELRRQQEAQAEEQRQARAKLAEEERQAKAKRDADEAAAKSQREKEDAERAAKQKLIDDANAAKAAELQRLQDEFNTRQKAEDDRRAADAKAAQDKADAEASERQAVIDAEAKKAADAAEAERKRIQAEADEAARIEREAAEARQRKEEAERAARVAADSRLRNAAPAMHRALTLWIAAEISGDADEIQQAREARDEALAEAQ